MTTSIYHTSVTVHGAVTSPANRRNHCAYQAGTIIRMNAVKHAVVMVAAAGHSLGRTAMLPTRQQHDLLSYCLAKCIVHNPPPLVVGHQGGVQHVVVGLSSLSDVWGYAALPGKLPPGAYALADDSDGNAPQLVNKAVLGWMLGALHP